MGESKDDDIFFREELERQKRYPNPYAEIKKNPSPGDNLQYLTIKIYKDGKFLADFKPNMIDSKYSNAIIFPSDFILDRNEMNSLLYKKKVLDRDNKDDLKNDYKLYGNIDKGKLTKLRLQGNAKTSDDVDTIIKKNVLYLTNIFFQENTIITIDGIDKQILSAKIITTKNDDINADILTNRYRNERLRISYQKDNQDFYNTQESSVVSSFEWKFKC